MRTRAMPSTMLKPLAAATVVAMGLTGCASNNSTTVVPNPFETRSSDGTKVQVSTMRVFGDSYSDIRFTDSKRVVNWTSNLKNNGTVATVDNFAIGGARVAPDNHKSLVHQIDSMEATKKPIGDADLTVVYLGHNDINRNGSGDNLTRAKAAYTTGVERLIALGAATDNRRLFLTQLHDWSRNPDIQDSVHSQVVAWNNYIASQANAHDNVIAVDMFTAFERVFAQPDRFGFTNVRTADAKNSSTTALFNDGTHFGTRGQTIISRVYQHYLTRGWNWANSLNAGTSTATRLGNDIDRGVLAYSVGDASRIGSSFNLIPIGESDSGAVKGQGSNRFVNQSLGFSSRQLPTGLALNYSTQPNAEGQRQSFGVALSQVDVGRKLDGIEDRTAQKYNAQATSLYWLQNASDFLLTTQLSNLQLQHDSIANDSLLNRFVSNTSSGSSWSFEQKIRRPMGNEFMAFTPWVSLAAQSHKINPYQAKTLYTTDTTFSATTANEWLSGIGFDWQMAPIHLGHGKKLSFGGSLNHLQSLRRDAVVVSMQEARTPGFTQRETVEREKISRTQLGFNAGMELSKNVNLNAAYATDLSKVKATQNFSLLANLRY